MNSQSRASARKLQPCNFSVRPPSKSILMMLHALLTIGQAQLCLLSVIAQCRAVVSALLIMEELKQTNKLTITFQEKVVTINNGISDQGITMYHSTDSVVDRPSSPLSTIGSKQHQQQPTSKPNHCTECCNCNTAPT